MNDTIWLTLRRLRTPLIAMIVIYSLSVFGLLLIPGQDADGNPYTLKILDAAYFVAIMATTIGFGEVPFDFTDAQRLYAYLVVFPNVVAWLYSIGTILALFIDPQFKAVMHRGRFAQRVRWLSEPFYIVCGFGSTGSMITAGLGRRGISASVLEGDESVIHHKSLDDDFAQTPALHADVTDRRLLEVAGLNNPLCKGVIAITNEDHANLTVAITVKLLRPELPVFARSETERTSRNMASFGTDYIIDPYAIFAERMFLALSSPIKYLLQDWLISVPGSKLRDTINPPSGRWIIAGLGRFGSRVAESMLKADQIITVIDVHAERLSGFDNVVQGRGTEAHTLEEAGVDSACGIIAGTDDDIDNLSIVMTARELNPKIFVVVRQESQPNDELFDASGADLIARRGFIVARRVLAVATTPLLQAFLEYVVRNDDSFAQKAIARCEDVLHGRAPNLWTVEITDELAEGVKTAVENGVEVRLNHVNHNTRSENTERLDCVCLVIERGASRKFLPSDEQDILAGDRLLFAGRGPAQREVLWTLSSPDALLAYATGRHLPSGSVGRWIQNWQEQRQSAASKPEKRT
ncbi:MAG TPA: NAD-binding protein [Xanthomonadales bacterium]|nr:NAD-binding protein [Xanthomonadales bacterium]